MSILLIDDTELDLALMSAMISDEHREGVVEARSAAEGLAAAARRSFDLIVVDHVMPGRDGLDFIESVRRIPLYADTPIIMATASDATELRLAALERGATDFVSKPYDPAEMKARIRNLLQLSHAMRRLEAHAHDLASEVTETRDLVSSREAETVLYLARAAEYRDPETGAHIKRTAALASEIAGAIGMGPTFCREVRLAMPMHDIGKLGIPDDILMKAGPLSDAERSIIERHTTFGAELLAGSSSALLKMASEIALTHHERWDGSGYPRGLAGADIPVAGRIAAVADVFDALTAARSYKRAWSRSEALEYMRREAGRLFDPICVDALVRLCLAEGPETGEHAPQATVAQRRKSSDEREPPIARAMPEQASRPHRPTVSASKAAGRRAS